MLQVNQLTFTYPRSKAAVIDGLGFKLEAGHIYGLLGSNGVGKTTLLELLCGALTPARGSVTLDGADVRRRHPSTMADIMVVPDTVTFPICSLSRWVDVHSRLYPRFSHEQLHGSLLMLGIDRDLDLSCLSMGQRKKVFIAFALAANTRVLLMDEPTNGLDIPSRQHFRQLLAMAGDTERIILVSTHQVHDLDGLLDHVLILSPDGRLALDASIERIEQRLAFTVTGDPALLAHALYVAPALGGTAAVLPASAGLPPTKADLEMLFNLTLNNPASLNEMLS